MVFSQHRRFMFFYFFFQAEDGIRDATVTGVQTCALPISLQAAVAAPLLPCQPLVQSSDGLLTLPRLPELGSTLGPMGGTIWVARERIPPQRRPATGGEESVRSIDRPSMGLLRRPTLGEIVEDGRFNRSYGLGAHSRIRETGSSS